MDLSHGVKFEVRKHFNRVYPVKFEARKYFTGEGAYFTGVLGRIMENVLM